jgi:ABC-type molybdate transport system substrate-binding protein
MYLKLPDDPIQLVLGKAFHSALEQSERDKANIVNVFEKEFTKDKVKQVSVEKYAMEKEEALRLLKYWSENKAEMLKEQGFKITEHEVPFDLRVDQDPLTKQKLNLPPIKGFVDFVTDNGKIGDYKTSSKKYSQEMVDTSDQPTFYYLWHLIERGKLPAGFVYIVFRKGIKKVPIQILETQRTMKQVSDLLASLQAVVFKIQDKKYYERHNENEYFCDCTLYEEMLKV